MADYGVRITLSADSPIPAHNVAPWVNGVASLSSGAVSAGWTAGRLISVSPVGEQADIASGGNYAEVSEFRAVIDANGYPSFLSAGASLLGAVVEVGTLAAGVLTERFRGVVADLSWEGAEIDIQVESITTLRHMDIPSRILTAQEFPGTPAASEGAVVPIVYGAVEGMTPPTIISQVDYLPAQYTRFDGANVERVSTFVPVYAGVPAVGLLTAVFCYGITEEGGAVPAGVATAIYAAQDDGKSVFMEITDGTGAGQSRLLVGEAAASGDVDPGNGFRVGWLSFDIASPWDTLPDQTSVFRIYADAVGASLAVGDEATISRVVAYAASNEYPIGYSVKTVDGIVLADVSSEFRNGEDYSAIDYQIPTSVFGVPEMSDLVTATTANDVDGITSVVNSGIGYDYRTWDGYCRGRIEFGSIPSDAIRDEADIYVTASLDASALVKDSDSLSAPIKAWPQVIVRRFVGADHRPQIVVGDTPGTVAIPFDSFNAYPPAIASDGTPGQFQSYAWKIPSLPFPLSAVASIEWAVIMSARPNGSAQLAAGRVHAERGTGNNMVRPGGYTTPLPTVGQFVRPLNGGDGEIHNGVSGTSGATVYQSGQWREVTGIVDADTFTVTDSSAWPADDLEYIIIDAAQLATVHERETGLAFVYGSISRESQFEVATSSGRTFSTHWPALPSGVSNGDPITQPRDMALDILYRDLGLIAAQVDFAAFQALPSGTVSAAIVEQEGSRVLLARLAREWNWVLAHDLQGRETATAWLEPMHSVTSDYSIANADVVAGTLVGIDQTALEDIVTMPDLSWSWTEADGFRSSGTVTDVSVPPASLSASNYLQYITGLGDFATSLDAYTVLHEAWKRSIVMRRGSIEYRTGGDPLNLYYGALLEWAASRKDLLDLRVNEGHAAASAHVGQRVDVTHRRYTGGGTVYGTVVGRWWHPEDGQAQLLVMLDHAEFVDGTGLYVDTLDGTTAQYIDQLDGTSPEYIDTPGGT